MSLDRPYSTVIDFATLWKVEFLGPSGEQLATFLGYREWKKNM